MQRMPRGTLPLAGLGLLLALLLPGAAGAAWPLSWVEVTAPPGAEIEALAVDPNDPSRLWASNRGDYDATKTYLYRSEDAGQTWELLGGGLPDICTYGEIDVHPDGQHLATVCESVYLSEDSGFTWRETFPGQGLRWAALAPADHRVIYVDTVDGDRNHHLYRSDDAGLTWSPIGADLSPALNGALEVEKVVISGSDARRAWLLVQGTEGFAARGIWRTEDAGATWSRITGGGLLHCVGSLAARRDNDWLYAVSVAPGEACGSKETALYRSQDGGATWEAILPDVYFNERAIASSNPDVMYAYSSGAIHRSADGGTTWQNMGEHSVGMLVVDADNPDRLYSLQYGEGLRVSTDGGATWKLAGSGQIHGYLPRTLVGRPGGGLYAGALGNVYWTVDGTTWTPTDGTTPPQRRISALALDRTDGNVLYAGLGGTYFAGVEPSELVWRSQDGGRTWEPSYSGLPEAGAVSDILVDPDDGRVLFVALTDNQYAQAPPAYLYRSVDGGQSWQPITEGLPVDAEGHPDLVSSVVKVGDRYYAGTRYGVYRSGEGASWQGCAFLPGQVEGDFQITRMAAVDGRLFALSHRMTYDSSNRSEATESNVYWSEDGCQSWNAASGLPDNVQFSDLAAPRGLQGRMYALWTRSYWPGNFRVEYNGLHASDDGGWSWFTLPAPGSTKGPVRGAGDGAVYMGVKHAGVVRSRDGGTTWQSLGREIAGSPDITAVAGFEDTVYAGSFWSNLFRSDDRGQTWQLLSPGLGTTTAIVSRIAVHRTEPETIYVTTETLGTGGHGLFRSADGGRIWVNVRPGHAHDVALVPGRPDDVWAAMGYDGVCYSRDKGDTWDWCAHQYTPVYSVAVSPKNPDLIFVGTTAIVVGPDSGACVFRSVDGGSTWEAVLSNATNANACSQKSATTVRLDPHDPDRVFSGGHYSEDGGETWAPGGGIAPAFSPDEPGLVYDLGSASLRRSRDGGKTWETIGGPAEGASAVGVGWSASGAPRLYAMSADDPCRFWYALDTDVSAVVLPLLFGGQ